MKSSPQLYLLDGSSYIYRAYYGIKDNSVLRPWRSPSLLRRRAWWRFTATVQEGISGPGGYGVILRYGDHEMELSGFELATTSQRMELIAAIRGLEALNSPRRVHLRSDSQYLVRGMSEWLPGSIATVNSCSVEYW